MPSALFNGMTNPLIPYGVKGAIWYQGESNTNRATEYRTLLPTIIADSRSRWGEGGFPFYIVQLANFKAQPTDPTDDARANLRDTQLYTSETIPNTGLAVIDDIGSATTIHPSDKQDIGKRLSLIALAKTYGEKLFYSGPIYSGMKIEGSAIRVSFSHVDGGLVAKGGEPLTGFAISGADGNWVWANAKIDGDTVLVLSPSVAKPTMVRFTWSNNPIFNLYNKAGLPASPFRTYTPVTQTDYKLSSDTGPDLAFGAHYVSSDAAPSGWNNQLTDGIWNGDQGTTFATNDNAVFPKSVVVDLAKPANIGIVAIGVPDYGSTKTIDVSVSLDGTSYKDVGSYVFSQNKYEQHVFMFAPSPTRFIKLTYPDHYGQIVVNPPTIVYTTELAAYAPGASH